VIQVHRPRVWLLLVGAVVVLLAVKWGRPALLPGGPPLELGKQPSLLFFNNEEGCECVLPLYARADSVIDVWPPEQRSRVPVYRIILDERPDLQRQYDVERAPMLLLLDANGQVLWRERGVASNSDVFDLSEVEAQIDLLVTVTEID